MAGEIAEIAALGRLKLRETAHRIRGVREQPLLKITVLAASGAVLWSCLYLMFHYAFSFLGNDAYADFKPWVLRTVFPIFFLCLGSMIGISGGVVAHAGLFHSPETAFLQTLPIRPTSIYVLKLVEVALVSSWAFVFLGVPLIAAFAATAAGLPPVFLPVAFLFFAFFLWIPVALGCLVSILVSRFLPSSARMQGTTLFVAGGLGLGWGAWQIVHTRWPKAADAELYFHSLFERLHFGSNPFYPSYWIGRGLVDVSEGAIRDGLFYLLMTAANALFMAWLGYVAAARFLPDAAARSRARGGGRRFVIRMLLFRIFRPLGLLLPRIQRTIFEKDLRTFFRDSTQWSQFTIFFGLLGVYFFNLRRLPYNVDEPYWQSLISFLNLSATALTLCTFTSRFIFPMVSLEGKRFWVLGLAPIRRRDILAGKFVFAFLGAALVSCTLIAVSDLQIRVPRWLLWVHLYTMLLISLGLAGLSVGLGTLYPNFKEDNPSKIVSGFGGTLNLVLGLAFICAMIAMEAVPIHLWYARGALTQEAFRLWLGGTLVGATFLAITACYLPLWRAERAFERMEV